MSDDTVLVHRLIGGDPKAPGEVLESAVASDSPSVLVAAALITPDPRILTRAAAQATTTRDRQLVALAAAHLRGDDHLFDALVRDHLADYPDHLLAAWIAGRRFPTHSSSDQPHQPTKERSMAHVDTAPPPPAISRRPFFRRTIPRWMVSFAGFPLGGLVAFLVVGPVDNLGSALAGGLLTGGILGAIQAWALGTAQPRRLAWTVATAVGLAVGLALGASLVDFRVGLDDLVLQGAVSGAVVGLAQALVLVRLVGLRAFAWPLALSAIWAIAWTVSTAIGIQVDDRYTIFGSSGALVATALTLVLPILLQRRAGVSRS
jgi:hypothetical protein